MAMKDRTTKFIGDMNIETYPSHSFRNFEVGKQFKDAMNKCGKRKPEERLKCERNVRGLYRYVESGRLVEMGDKIHSFISHLDSDEVQLFKNKFPDATKIANEFAVVEELMVFD